MRDELTEREGQEPHLVWVNDLPAWRRQMKRDMEASRQEAMTIDGRFEKGGGIMDTRIYGAVEWGAVSYGHVLEEVTAELVDAESRLVNSISAEDGIPADDPTRVALDALYEGLSELQRKVLLATRYVDWMRSMITLPPA